MKREKGDLALSFTNWLCHGKLPNAMEVPENKREKRGRERGRAAEERGRRRERERKGERMRRFALLRMREFTL